MEVTGHKTQAMFKRYADLFSDEEKRQRQLEVHQRRHEWREAQQNEQEKPHAEEDHDPTMREHGQRHTKAGNYSQENIAFRR